MTVTNKSFQSEKFIVDYIAFKFQQLKDDRQQEIEDYLLEQGFNSYSAKFAKPVKELLS